MQYSNINATHGLKLLWLLTVLMAFYYNLHGTPLFDIDEGAFAQATREMTLRDDYLTLYLNGEPRHDKPILTYWLQALSVKAFGVSEFAFRLPSAIAATLWNLLIVIFTWRLTTPSTALKAGILMAGTLGTGIIGKAATADALLNLFLTGTLFSIYFNFVTRQTRYLVAAAFFAGLGFLTKGPVALLIPSMVSLVYALVNGQFQHWLKMIVSPSAWMVFLSVGLPWYIINYLKEGSGFIEGFIGVHNIGRFTQAMESHSGPWWYYLPMFLLMAFPFSYILLRPFLKFNKTITSPFNRFLIAWFLLVLIFFTLSATKLPHYILYGLTPLFILGAIHLDDKTDLKPVYIPLLLFVVLMLALPRLISHFITYFDNHPLTEFLSNPANYLPGNYYLILIFILVSTIWLFTDRRWLVQGRLLSTGIITIFIASELLIPIVGKIQQTPIREAGHIAQRYEQQTVMWRINNPSFSVYSGRITPKRKPTEGELVLTKSRHLKRLPSHQLLYERQGVALALIDIQEHIDVSGQSETTAQKKPLDNSIDTALQRTVSQTDETQRIPVSMDQQPGTSDPGSSPMGNTNRSWGWTSSTDTASAILQTPPQIRYSDHTFRPDFSRMDTPSQSWFRYPTPSHQSGQGNIHHYRTDTQTRQLPLRSYSDHFRFTRQHRALAKIQPSKESFTNPRNNWHTRSHFSHSSWRPLAAGYPDRRKPRLDFCIHRQCNDSAPLHYPTGSQLVRPFPYPVHRIPPFISPNWLYRSTTNTSWYRPPGVGPGLLTTSETTSNSSPASDNLKP
jgi:hypothetical protein